MRNKIIIVSIFAFGLIAGILMIQIPELINHSPSEKTEDVQEVEESEDSKGRVEDAKLNDTSSSTNALGQVTESQVLHQVRLDVEGCPADLSMPPQSTIYRICTTYTTDGNHVYFNDVRMEADAGTFKVYPVGIQDFVTPDTTDLLFAHDHNTVYFQDRALVGVTPDKFNILGRDMSEVDQTLKQLIEDNPSLRLIKIFSGESISPDQYAYLDELLPRLQSLDSEAIAFEDSTVPNERLDDFARSLRVNGDYLVATVNGKNLMYSDLGEMYIPSSIPRSWLADSDKHKESKEKFTNELIERKLLLDDARKRGVVLTSEELKVQLVKSVKDYGERENVLEHMMHFGLREERFYFRVRDNLLQDKYIQKFILDNIEEPTDKEIAICYEENYGQSSETMKLEDVKESIISSLKNVRKQELVDKHVSKLKRSANIVIID